MQPKLINFIKFDSRVFKSCQEHTKRYSIQPNTVRVKEIYLLHALDTNVQYGYSLQYIDALMQEIKRKCICVYITGMNYEKFRFAVKYWNDPAVVLKECETMKEALMFIKTNNYLCVENLSI
ncbi:hypothetical protein [Klebsiella phage phiKp_21]|nr:hypothetical protein [Klebsiella phage phiKp_21]